MKYAIDTQIYYFTASNGYRSPWMTKEAMKTAVKTFARNWTSKLIVKMYYRDGSEISNASFQERCR